MAESRWVCLALEETLGKCALILDGGAVELRDRPAGRLRMAAGHGDGLLPGRKHGSHLTAERLKPIGIRATRRGRHGALLALAGRLAFLAARARPHRCRVLSSSTSSASTRRNQSARHEK